jgi:nitronate monooxygenase
MEITSPLTKLRTALRLPVIVAPMLLVSGPELVIACCRAGVVGSFPAANARTAEDCEAWLTRIDAELRAAPEATVAPYAFNVIVKDAGTERFDANLALARRFAIPIVITSVGDPGETAKFVHGYGGVVLHDVATLRHAEKAIAAGVDGLILLTAGAGGHTGSANPFAFVRDVRRIWNGPIILAGGISDGPSIRAAEVMGADFAYMGTRFAATRESAAPPAYKELLVSQRLADIMTTDRISGLNATFMRGSIEAAGLDPDNLPPTKGRFQPDLPEGIKAWRDVWSAGHGVGGIDDVPTVAELAARLEAGYGAVG